MEYDGKMLNYISREEDVSQRKIANYMGLSLGQTNFILHDLVKKGLIKIERISPRNVRYILTPQGIAKNAKRTYNYIIKAIRNLLSLQAELISIVEDYTPKGYSIYLDQEKDEIYNILQQIVKERKLTQIKWVTNAEELVKANEKALVILWHDENIETYEKLSIEYVNLLNRIGSL